MVRAYRAIGVLVAALALGACARPADPGPRAESPLERRVFQRGRDGTADVAVVLSASADSPGLEIRVRYADGTVSAWSAPRVARDPATGDRRWKATLRVPEGGWHALEYRTSAIARPAVAVRRFGVGELFVIAGQSNATNWGERDPAHASAVNDLVSAFDGRVWTVARDPMPGAQDDSSGASPWPRFGDLLERELGVPVGLAVVGHGNTSILDWLPDGPPRPDGPGKPLYPALRDRVRRLGAVRAILWHQGERDVWERLDTGAYVAAFLRLRDGLAADTGCAAPWIVARASFEPGADENAMRAIRDAQGRLWAGHEALRGPDTDELRGELRARDGVHFSARGLEVHARLWYERVVEAIATDPSRVGAP